MEIYGPYTRSDGRKHVIHYDPVTQTRRTQSYPRYLMEQHLGRVLKSTEHVDHINNDFTDDRIENLQLLTQQQNNAKSARKTEWWVGLCPICQDEFSIPMRRVRANQAKQNKRGPYCSKSCAGKAGVVE